MAPAPARARSQLPCLQPPVLPFSAWSLPVMEEIRERRARPVPPAHLWRGGRPAFVAAQWPGRVMGHATCPPATRELGDVCCPLEPLVRTTAARRAPTCSCLRLPPAGCMLLHCCRGLFPAPPDCCVSPQAWRRPKSEAERCAQAAALADRCRSLLRLLHAGASPSRQMTAGLTGAQGAQGRGVSSSSSSSSARSLAGQRAIAAHIGSTGICSSMVMDRACQAAGEEVAQPEQTSNELRRFTVECFGMTPSTGRR